MLFPDPCLNVPSGYPDRDYMNLQLVCIDYTVICSLIPVYGLTNPFDLLHRREDEAAGDNVRLRLR
jgi:hypothetical protein